VTLNGRPVGRVAKAGRQECAFAVPAALLGTNAVARLELVVATWKPSEHGGGDARALGVSVRQVELIRAGAESSAAAGASLRMAVDPQALAPLTRAVGKGKTLFLQGLADDTKTVALVLAGALAGAPDGRLDAGSRPRLATVCSGSTRTRRGSGGRASSRGSFPTGHWNLISVPVWTTAIMPSVLSRAVFQARPLDKGGRSTVSKTAAHAVRVEHVERIPNREVEDTADVFHR
jgi:hypothetical protein